MDNKELINLINYKGIFVSTVSQALYTSGVLYTYTQVESGLSPVKTFKVDSITVNKETFHSILDNDNSGFYSSTVIDTYTYKNKRYRITSNTDLSYHTTITISKEKK